IHHQLADILHSAISLKMLDKQMAEIECPGSKKQVKLDTIHLSIGADGFNATKATVTSVTAVAIRVLNLPIDVQSRL
ncbi:hypothetical protein LPJ54_002776, partial [Coemansia sp. RSA 1824]